MLHFTGVMKDWKFWKITPKDRKIAERARQGLRNVEQRLREVYSADVFTLVSLGDAFKHSPRSIDFLLGKDLDHPVALASGSITKPVENIAQATEYLRKMELGKLKTGNNSISLSSRMT